MSDIEEETSRGIAIIGMACRFPGANSADEFWQNLRSGTESITRFSEEELLAAGVSESALNDPNFVPVKGAVSEGDGFDAGFFGFSPREAALMDPQQRYFLECAHSSIEDAGYDSTQIDFPVGVFAGSILSIYLLQNVWPNKDLVRTAGNFQTAVGNDPTFLATSASYQLDLKGPSISVGTACSTSLVAVHLACQSLLSYECDMALAGGVSVHPPLIGGYRYEDGGILSPDGHCRPFDAGAQGTVSSDGAGVVTLKRLEDAIADGDTIDAVILGSAINNDGSNKVGFTAPSVGGEAQAISEALAMAGVAPEELSLVETHGAGTLLGDPIEVAALTEAFAGCSAAEASCALGAVKSNVGHLDAAAGIAGLMKAALALREREIPPTLHFQTLNPQISFEDTPFYVNAELQPMIRGEHPLRAGVNSFGIGGTNAHLVLEEPPRASSCSPVSPARPFELLTISARTESGLDRVAERLGQHLQREDDMDLADVGFTLRVGRRCFEHRRFVVAGTLDEAASQLRKPDSSCSAVGVAPSEKRNVAFMFPGLGDHYPEMGWELYCVEPEFRRVIDECAEHLEGKLRLDIRDVLFPEKNWSNPVFEPTKQSGSAESGAKLDFKAMLQRARGGADDSSTQMPTELGQPAIFVIEYALAKLLGSWGVQPDAMIGHSVGEFVAACLSGVLSLPDALMVVAARAKLIENNAPEGCMLATPLGETELKELLPTGVSVGAVNGASLTIASGEPEGVSVLEKRLEDRGVSCQRVSAAHAYHSHMMEAIVPQLMETLSQVTLNPPRIPYISCISGDWITSEQAVDPDYWARHLCHTVRFQQGLLLLFRDSNRALLEVGPGQGLTSHAITARLLAGEDDNPIVPSMRWSYGNQSEHSTLLNGMGQLWLSGAGPDMGKFLPRENQRRVKLPSYPFERSRHWIDPPGPGEVSHQPEDEAKKEDITQWFYVPYWKPASPPRRGNGDSEPKNWLIFADTGGVAESVLSQLRDSGDFVATVSRGDEFEHLDDSRFLINPTHPDSYQEVLQTLIDADQAPDVIVHMWGLENLESLDSYGVNQFRAAQKIGYHSLRRLVAAASRARLDSVRIEIVADQVFDVTGVEPLAPEKATLCGPALVASQEHPGISCRLIDMGPSTAGNEQLLRELRAPSSSLALALRGGRSWTQSFEQTQIEAEPLDTPYRKKGVYLITGGAGGVAFSLAKRLAKNHQARLALLGRSPVPPRDEWEAWVAEYGPSEAISVKIRRMQELEKLGAEVLPLTANVSDLVSMTEAFAAIEAHFGELHGVIHAAGVIGMDAFEEITNASGSICERQFVAKAQGLLVLEQVMEGRQLDFCCLVSSLASILGGLGFSAYSAANLYMDAFAQKKSRDSIFPWTSINWDTWQSEEEESVDQPVTFGSTVNQFVMTAEEGAEACERILAQRYLPQVIVSTGDLDSRLRQWVERSDELPQVTLHDRPDLEIEFEPARGELEFQLSEIWQELFGLNQVGIHDNFFQLGGHSLLATQLNARLAAKLDIEMSLATLLKAPTIAELAVSIVNARAELSDPDQLESMLSEIEDMSVDEIERLLEKEGSDLEAPPATN